MKNLFSVSFFLSCCLLIAPAATLYVDRDNGAPQTPFTNGWASAAVTIQDAVDIAVSNDVILVAPGTYDTGTRMDAAAWGTGSMSNRVFVTNQIAITAFSTNPADTVITGAPDTRGGSSSNGDSAVRAVFLGCGAQLTGFTISNSYTRWNTYRAGRGGGVCAEDASIISNCVLICNYAYSGGGVFGGTSVNCRVSYNTAYYGGGFRAGIVFNCLIASNTSTYFGGGGYQGSYYNCTIVSNIAVRGGGLNNVSLAQDCQIIRNAVTQIGAGAYQGTYVRCNITGNHQFGGNNTGGAYQCNLYECVISDNFGNSYGGIYLGKAINCLVFGNRCNAGGSGVHGVDYMLNCTVTDNSGGAGAIAGGGGFTNCIVYSNAPSDFAAGTYDINHVCAVTNVGTFPGALSVITNNPLFLEPATTNYYLNKRSPCIDAGINMDWGTNDVDLAGNPRISPLGGIVDMGAYEYVHPPPGTIFTSF